MLPISFVIRPSDFVISPATDHELTFKRFVKSVDRKKKAYALAGVDVELGNLVKRRIQSRVKGKRTVPRCSGKSVDSAAFFAPDFSGLREPVLVASVDGVGTKLKIAFAMNGTTPWAPIS